MLGITAIILVVISIITAGILGFVAYEDYCGAHQGSY